MFGVVVDLNSVPNERQKEFERRRYTNACHARDYFVARFRVLVIFRWIQNSFFVA